MVHGERFDEEDHIGAVIVLEDVFCALSSFWDYRCVVQYEETTWNLSNSTPIQIESLDIIQSKEIILMSPDNKPLVSLSPLLCVRQDIDITAERIDEVFFINIGVLEREQLEYVGFQYAQHQHGKQLGTYEQFKSYLASIPTPYLPKEDKVDFSEYIQDKSKNFVGREEVFEELKSIIPSQDVSYIILRAHAGMGKSAIMAQLALDTKSPKKQQTDALWAFHFCMHTQGRDTPIVAYRSLIAQICEALNLQKKYISPDINELKDRFEQLLVASKSS